MLEIVCDCAPGAFAGGGATSLTFINAVNTLRGAGAQVIVDDLGFDDEPFFEDGLAARNDRTVGAVVLRVSARGTTPRTTTGAVHPGDLRCGDPGDAPRQA